MLIKLMSHINVYNFKRRAGCAHLCPNMWKLIFKILITLPISYLVEAGFSAANHILTTKRNALGISERGDIRLMLSKIKPNISDLISKHQSQGSH